MLLLILSITLTSALNERNAGAGRACSRIVRNIVFKDRAHLTTIIQQNPDLPQKKLENKLLSDAIDFCIQNIKDKQINEIRTSKGDYGWRDYKELIPLDPMIYKSEEDLIVSQEHLQLREEIIASERNSMGQSRNKPDL